MGKEKKQKHVIKASDMHCGNCQSTDVDFALVDFNEHAVYFDCKVCDTRTALDTGIETEEHDDN